MRADSNLKEDAAALELAAAYCQGAASLERPRAVVDAVLDTARTRAYAQALRAAVAAVSARGGYVPRPH